MIQKDLKGILILVFFALITAFFYNRLSPFGIALFGQWDSSRGGVTAISKINSVNGPAVAKPIEMEKSGDEKNEK